MSDTPSTPNTTFQAEAVADVLHAAAFLAHRQFDELRGPTPAGLKIDPALYADLERRGKLRIYTARADKTLLAAVVFVLSEHTHRHGIVAVSDAVLVPAELRRTGLASALIDYALAALKADGATAAQVVVKTAASKSGALERLGFSPIEVVYWKTLE